MSQLVRYLPIGDGTLAKRRRSWGFPYEKGKNAALRIHAPSWIKRYYAEELAELREGLTHKAADAPANTLDFDDRFKRARAEKSELELSEKLGALVSLDDLEKDVNEFCNHIREGIESLSMRDQEIMISKLEEAATVFGVGSPKSGSSKLKKTSNNGKAAN